MVLAIKNPKRGTTLVVGVMANFDFGIKQRINFQKSFREAAHEAGAKFRLDSFSGELMEIKSQDFKQFITILNADDE